MTLRTLLLSFLIAGCGGAIASSDGGTDSGTTDSKPPCSCSSSEYCQLDPTCGSSSGTCVARPMGCTDIYAPVCGTDGKVYDNACGAHAAGFDVATNGGCPSPQGYLACGGAFCDAATTYCQTAGNDVAGPNQPCAFTSCVNLPIECIKSTDCICFSQDSACQCAFDGNGFQLRCPGG